MNGDTDILVGNLDQLTQDSNFRVQLNVVKRRFERGLVDVEVHELDDRQRNIHQDTGR